MSNPIEEWRALDPRIRQVVTSSLELILAENRAETAKRIADQVATFQAMQHADPSGVAAASMGTVITSMNHAQEAVEHAFYVAFQVLHAPETEEAPETELA